MSENGNDRELILGNKQLLAIFFVGALLCGVFFAVGYVVGGNSAKSAGNVASDGSTPPVAEGKRDEPGAATPGLEAMAAGGASAPSGSTISETASVTPVSEPKMADNPAAAGAAPPPSTASQGFSPATPAPTTQIAAVTKTAPPVAAPASMTLSIPEKGAGYVQVAAQKRPAADAVVKSLRERGWPAILAESSKPELVEILVGPYSGVALADAKRKLVELGFAGAVIHRQQ